MAKPKEKKKLEKPLKIIGTLDEVLGVAMANAVVKPKKKAKKKTVKK